MEKNTDRPIEELYIDTRLDSYRNYLDDRRIHKIVSQLGEETVLSKQFFLLLMHLRGVSYNASMPYILPTSMEVFHSGFIQGTNPRQVLLDFSSAIMERLGREVPKLTKSPRLARKIKERIISISNGYMNRDMKLPVVDRETAWNAYLNSDNEIFVYTIWSNQRVSYLSGFSAYDNFMARIVKHARNLSKCQTTPRNKFGKYVEEAFGSEVAELAWTGDEMTTLHYIRNSLTHAGGKITDTFKQREHKCIIINDTLQITPADIKRLFEAITLAVEAIVEQSADNPYLTRELKEEK